MEFWRLVLRVEGVADWWNTWGQVSWGGELWEADTGVAGLLGSRVYGGCFMGCGGGTRGG